MDLDKAFLFAWAMGMVLWTLFFVYRFTFGKGHFSAVSLKVVKTTPWALTIFMILVIFTWPVAIPGLMIDDHMDRKRERP